MNQIVAILLMLKESNPELYQKFLKLLKVRERAK